MSTTKSMPQEAENQNSNLLVNCSGFFKPKNPSKGDERAAKGVMSLTANRANFAATAKEKSPAVAADEAEIQRLFDEGVRDGTIVLTTQP